MAKILVQYEADTSQLTAKLKGVEQANTKVDESAKKTGKTVTDSFTKAGSAVDGAGKKTNAFTNALNNAKGAASGYSNIFGQIASGIGAAFAVERVIAFAAASLKAFQDAELNAKKLQTAVGVNGGVSADFERLIEQSSILQKITIFSDDDIQKAQTIALQYGLTADQVEKLIPVITDYASATGDTLTGALNNVIGGLEGNARALKKQGIALVENADTATQLANITDQLNLKFKDQAQIIGETSAGAAQKLANQFDDLKENIGEFVSGFTDAGATILSFVLNGLEPLDDGLDSTTSKLKLTTEELNKFGNSVTNAQIALLQGQIDRISASGGDVSKLNEQLDKLRNKQLSVEITGLSNEELQAKIATLEGFQFKTKEVTDQIKLLQAEAKSRNLDLIVSEKELTSLTTAELEKRKKIIEDASKETNSATLRDAIEAITAELAARKKAGIDSVSAQDKAYQDLLAIQKDFEQKSKESQVKSEAEKLELQRQAVLDKAKEAFKNAGGKVNDAGKLLGDPKVIEAFLKAQAEINATYDKLIGDAKIAQAEKDAKAIQDIQLKSAKFVLEQNLKLIEDEGEKEKQARIANFNSVGDFSKTAYEALQTDLLKIDSETIAAQNEEREKGGVQAISNEKDITDAALDESKKRVDLTADEEAQKRELRLETVRAIGEGIGEFANLLSAFRDAEIQQIEDSKTAQLDAFDAELEALELRNERGADSDRVYEAKKKALLEQRLAAEKKADAELRKLKTEQAQQDKLKSIFDTILNTSTAIVAMLTEGSAGIPLSIAAGITGALQLATIIATPIPKFFEGEKFVKRGSNPIGRDTIPAMLNEGERVVTTANNKKHWEIYEAIENNEFKKFVQKHYVMPQLRAYKANQEKQSQKDFAGNIAASLTQQGLSYYDADRIRKKGMDINNTKELASLIAESLSDKLPKLYGRW